MTQATISTHMRHLEERLGLRLCSRGRSGFLLSGEGRLVYDAALELFGSLEKLQSRIGEAQGELTGNLSFGTVDAMITNRGRNLQVRLRHSTAKPRISARSRSFPKCRNSIAPRGIRCSTRPTER